jgi:hypothetical protein
MDKTDRNNCTGDPCKKNRPVSAGAVQGSLCALIRSIPLRAGTGRQPGQVPAHAKAQHARCFGPMRPPDRSRSMIPLTTIGSTEASVHCRRTEVLLYHHCHNLDPPSEFSTRATACRQPGIMRALTGDPAGVEFGTYRLFLS